MKTKMTYRDLVQLMALGFMDYYVSPEQEVQEPESPKKTKRFRANKKKSRERRQGSKSSGRTRFR